MSIVGHCSADYSDGNFDISIFGDYSDDGNFDVSNFGNYFARRFGIVFAIEKLVD